MNNYMNIDDILSHRDLCNFEDVQTLQRWMNYRLNPQYSVVLMSRRSNAPYNDKILDDWITIHYEWHDVPNTKELTKDPKELDQEQYTKSWWLTQNWYFIKSVKWYKNWLHQPEIIKIYEKLLPWVWSFKWFFNLIDYIIKFDWKRNVFVFTLTLNDNNSINVKSSNKIAHNRLIPSEIKKEVRKRDWWKCVLCWSDKNLHFDHDLPFSKWGSSITLQNIKILCAVCNLKKSDKIE